MPTTFSLDMPAFLAHIGVYRDACLEQLEFRHFSLLCTLRQVLGATQTLEQKKPIYKLRVKLKCKDDTGNQS